MAEKKKDEITIRSSTAEYLTYVASIGNNADSVEMRYEDENIWLTQKMMAALYDVDVRTINYHLKKIFEDAELQEDSVIRNFRITAADGKSYNTKHYNLNAIIAVGFKVNNQRAVRFRVCGGPALRVAGEQAGEIHKDGTHLGAFEERPEHDEPEQGRRRHADRDAVHAFIEQEKMFDDDVEGEARMLDGAGQHVSEEGVQDKRRGHDDQRPARGAAGDFEDEQDRCGGEEFGRRGYVVDVAHTGGDFGQMQGEVDRRGDGETRAAQVDKQKQRGFFLVFLVFTARYE